MRRRRLASGFAHLYVVTALVSVLSVFFDVAYQSLSRRRSSRNDELVEANSKLSAAISVAEAAAFSAAGWLIQLLTAPIAILVDAVTFLASAGLVARIAGPAIRLPTTRAAAATAVDAGDVARGSARGLARAVLRGMIVAALAQSLTFGYLRHGLSALRQPGGRIRPRHPGADLRGWRRQLVPRRDRSPAGSPASGSGAVMVASLFLAALGEAFVPLATAANALGMLFLVGQQIVGDAALTVYDINQVSLRQAIAPRAHPGAGQCLRAGRRSSARCCSARSLAGFLGEAIGLRDTLWFGVALSLVGGRGPRLIAGPRVRTIPAMPVEVHA